MEIVRQPLAGGADILQTLAGDKTKQGPQGQQGEEQWAFESVIHGWVWGGPPGADRRVCQEEPPKQKT
jgi:hypothetical protein